MFDHSISWLIPYERTDTRADSLLVGVLLAWSWSYGLIRRRVSITAWFAFAALGVLVIFGRTDQSFWYYGGFTLFAALVAIVILGAVEGQWTGVRMLSVRPLVLVGRVSYGLYLWHLPVFWAISRHTPSWPPIVRMIVALLLTVAATAVSWKLVERPAQRLRRRFGNVPIPEGQGRVGAKPAADMT